MSSTPLINQLIAVYGAVLSSILAALTVYRHAREQRYLVAYVEIGYDEDESVIFDVWLVNQSNASVDIFELWRGTGELEPIFRRLRSFLLYGSNLSDVVPIITYVCREENFPITLASGAAKKITIHKKELDDQLQKNLSIMESLDKKKYIVNNYLHFLELRHSRKVRPLQILLKPSKSSMIPADNIWSPRKL